MEIKLKNCTFSESAIIGTVRVPSSDAVLYAKKVSRNLSNKQLIALDDFVNNLKTDGIWEKITHLYIPSLAFVDGGENLREAFIDVVSSFGSTTTYGIEEELAKSEFVYKNGGVTNKTVKANSRRNGATFINGETINDSHVMFFVKSGETSTSQEGVEVWDRGFLGGVFNPPYGYLNADNIRIVVNNINFNLNNKNISAGEIFGHTAINNIGKTIGLSKLSTGSIDILSLENLNFPNNVKFATSEIQLSFGLVSFGKGLTDEETTKYIQYIKELMSAV